MKTFADFKRDMNALGYTLAYPRYDLDTPCKHCGATAELVTEIAIE